MTNKDIKPGDLIKFRRFDHTVEYGMILEKYWSTVNSNGWKVLRNGKIIVCFDAFDAFEKVNQ